MDEDIVTKEVIEFSDVIRMMSDFNHIVNDINKRFMWTVIIALMCITITVSSLAGFYFMADYSTVYPNVTQEQHTVDSKQSQKIDRSE